MRGKLVIDVEFDKLPNNKRAIVEVYNLIAKSAGVNPDRVKEYDCTKIDYSLNAEKLIFEKAGTEVDKVQVCVALAINGMKVDKSLGENKAVIHRGGIVMEDNRDIIDVVDTNTPAINEDKAFADSISKSIKNIPDISNSKGGMNIER